jgi:hypothetical protein
MRSCTTSAAWSRPVSLPCYIEYGQRCGAVLSGRITTVVMFKSSQLGLCCTVKPNYSDLFARLVGSSVTHDRALDTCEPSCVPGADRSFFILVVHSSLGVMGYVSAPKLSSRRGETEATWQRWSSPLGVAEPRAMRHVAAPEPTSVGRQGPELRNMWQHRSSTQQGGEARGHVTHDSTGAHLSKEVGSGATGHVAAPKPTSAGRCSPKL